MIYPLDELAPSRRRLVIRELVLACAERAGLPIIACASLDESVVWIDEADLTRAHADLVLDLTPSLRVVLGVSCSVAVLLQLARRARALDEQLGAGLAAREWVNLDDVHVADEPTHTCGYPCGSVGYCIEDGGA